MRHVLRSKLRAIHPVDRGHDPPQLGAGDHALVFAIHAAQEQLKWQMIGDKERVLKLKAHRPNYDDSKWKIVQLPNAEPLTDFAWLRKSFDLSADDLTLPATLELGELVQNAMLFVNGKLIAEENWLNKGATYRLPAGRRWC